jgi:hypothetical protein
MDADDESARFADVSKVLARDGPMANQGVQTHCCKLASFRPSFLCDMYTCVHKSEPRSLPYCPARS